MKFLNLLFTLLILLISISINAQDDLYSTGGPVDPVPEYECPDSYIPSENPDIGISKNMNFDDKTADGEWGPTDRLKRGWTRRGRRGFVPRSYYGRSPANFSNPYAPTKRRGFNPYAAYEVQMKRARLRATTRY